jgi:hypothetical protein
MKQAASSACLVYSLALEMDATWSSEMSADFQRTTRHYISADRILHGSGDRRNMILRNVGWLSTDYTALRLSRQLFKVLYCHVSIAPRVVVSFWLQCSLDVAGDEEEGKRDASRNEGGKKIDEEAACLSLKTKQRQEGNRRSFTKTKKERLRHIN